MGNWGNPKKNLFIPDKGTPKTYICKVCGSKIIPRSEDRYVAKEKTTTGGIASALNGVSKEPTFYDCFDCKVCGCQFVAKERMPKV